MSSDIQNPYFRKQEEMDILCARHLSNLNVISKIHLFVFYTKNYIAGLLKLSIYREMIKSYISIIRHAAVVSNPNAVNDFQLHLPGCGGH